MTGQRGLTLIELLVALGIFAAISAAMVGTMDLATGAKERTETVAEQLKGVERMRGILRADLQQIVVRPVREPDFAAPVPVILGGLDAQTVFPEGEEGEVVHLAFVTNGWSNPGYREPRASLQRVIYLSRGGRLIRRTRPYLDALRETPSRDQILLSGAEDIAFSFPGATLGTWVPDWSESGSTIQLKAVRVRTVLPELGAIDHQFWVGGG
ncbi:general secretion pathway protein J [Parvularcula bermudensis HTCC2503]|uniref:Type II secretion system protein J n=1 Tax=Parvularcula bermudensis (strain ATCC BAA-594 / HTCC2503 / KCTC 12087) TaxID=314260 RepID=E0TBQ6_PARBH|nr:type II secretion system minor pseudopilin GspJ [Parvularcula bermudensis]ADM09777.1 general secretion pathway protein J [Parvularcula bermudensis HTCC2503]